MVAYHFHEICIILMHVFRLMFIQLAMSAEVQEDNVVTGMSVFTCYNNYKLITLIIN